MCPCTGPVVAGGKVNRWTVGVHGLPPRCWAGLRPCEPRVGDGKRPCGDQGVTFWPLSSHVRYASSLICQSFCPRVPLWAIHKDATRGASSLVRAARVIYLWIFCLVSDISSIMETINEVAQYLERGENWRMSRKTKFSCSWPNFSSYNPCYRSLLSIFPTDPS